MNTRVLGLGFCSLCLSLSQASATSLPLAGGSAVPASITLGSGSGFTGAPKASANDLEFWKNSALVTEGSVNYVQGVWVDPTTHFLDFFYQIQNNSPAITGSTGGSSTIGNQGGAANPTQTTLVLTGFGPGITENVFEITSAQFVAGTLGGSLFVKPSNGETVTSVSNAIPGELIVNFNEAITPGSSSAILLVETNATATRGGQALLHWKQNPAVHGGKSGSAFNSESITMSDLAPAPEPGAYGVLSLAIAGLVFAVQLRSARAKRKSVEAKA
jgi:hypothetical protein